MPVTASPRTVRPLPGEVVTVPATGPGAMLRVLTDLAEDRALAPIARIPDLDAELDVIGTVLQPTRFLPVPPTRRERARVGRMLEQFGLAQRLGRRPHQLALDDLRRVAVVRAVAARAAVVVLDDPASGLETDRARDLLRELRAAAGEHGFGLVLLQEEAAPADEQRAAA